MSRVLRVYYYAILGAIGGLVAWQLSNVLGLSFVANLYLSEAVVGGLIGLCVGLPLGAAEGLMTGRPLRALRAGAFSGLAGFAAGAVALPLSEWIFVHIPLQIPARALGWSLFGLLIGLAEGVTGGAQLWKGALGGVIGGFVGGLALEAARRWLAALALGKVAGLLLLGAAVGAFIALISVLLSRAWLEVVSGKLEGTDFILDKFMAEGGPTAIVGSSALKAEIALPDPDIAPQHAILSGAGSHFSIKDISLTGTRVNGRPIERAQLSDGQRIEMGHTAMVYHERR
jgi:hypothetical protein